MLPVDDPGLCGSLVRLGRCRSEAALTAGAPSRVDEDCFDLGVDGSELVRCPGFVDVVELVRDAQQELFSLACHECRPARVWNRYLLRVPTLTTGVVGWSLAMTVIKFEAKVALRSLSREMASCPSVPSSITV